MAIRRPTPDCSGWRGTRPAPARRVRRRTSALLAIALLVGAAIGLTSCSPTTSATVTLIPTRPGQVSNVVAYQFVGGVVHLQIRITSGTGRTVAVRPYHVQDLVFEAWPGPTTVVDTGPGAAWTSIADIFQPGKIPGPADRIMVRLTTAATTDVPLTVEARGVDAAGQVVGSTLPFSPFGLDCWRVQPRTDLRAVDLSGRDLRRCVIPGVTLDPAKLHDTVLDGADLSQATILPGQLLDTNLHIAELGDATLAGVNVEGSNVAAANLSHANLDHASLAGTNLEATNLRGATISGTDLRGATVNFTDFTGATGTPVYAGVDFATATCPDGTLGSAHGNTCQGHPWP